MRTPPPITDLFQNGQNSGPKINIPDTNIPQQDDCFVYTQADAQASRALDSVSIDDDVAKNIIEHNNKGLISEITDWFAQQHKVAPTAKSASAVKPAKPAPVVDPVVMNIAGRDVSKSEFQSIYNKNNNVKDPQNSKSLEDYVQLFINFKLKVKEAEEMGLTLGAVKEHKA